MKTGVLLSDSAQQLRPENADPPDIYFTLLDAAGLSPTPVLNQNAKAKKRGKGGPSRTQTTEAATIVHSG